MGTFRLSGYFPVEASNTFKKEVEEATFRNGTGGIMGLYFYDGLLWVYGANDNADVKDNKLYIFDDIVIDFTKETINPEYC